MENSTFKNFLLESNIHFYDEEKPFNSIIRDNLKVFSSDVPAPSFFLNDVGELANNVEILRKVLPTIDLYYKISANADPVIIKALNCCNVKFSVSSGPEIDKLISLGISSSNIMYNGVCKLNNHVRTSAVNDVKHLSYGTLSELKNIANNHPDAELFLRIESQLYIEDSMDKLINVCAGTDQSIRFLLQKAKSLNMCVNGIEVMISKKMPENLYEVVFNDLLRMLSIVSEENVKLKHVYLNGGIESASSECHENKQFSALVKCINEVTRDYPDIHLMLEPTELIIETAAQLCCSIISTNSSVHPSEEFGNMFYYLNDGLYGSLGSILFREYNDIPDIIMKDSLNEVSNEENPRYDATFWGPTCDSMDKICFLRDVPMLNVGDVLRFKKLGAFGFSGASTFNGFSLASNFHMISFQKLEMFGITRTVAEEICTEKTKISTAV